MTSGRPKIYLAGPISNCNEKQKTKWRKEAGNELSKLGCEIIDPTRHEKQWHPRREIIEIDSADLLLANLWKESIGTVLGIFQAVRRGKPVILIDSNYIESQVLRELVGEEDVVRSLDGAIRRLKQEIPRLRNPRLRVEKKKGKIEPFKYDKLQRSLSAACSDANINDTALPVLLARKTYEVIRQRVHDGRVSSAEIEELVFEQLQHLTDDGLYAKELKDNAAKLKEEWELQKVVVRDKREMEELRQRNAALVAENARMKQELEATRGVSVSDQATATLAPRETRCDFPSVDAAVRQASIDFQGWLVFHDKAFTSAKDCPFHRPQDIYMALESLALFVANRQYEKETTIGVKRPSGLRDWLRRQNCPFEYSPNESQQTQNLPAYARERKLRFGTTEIMIRKHLKFGRGNANQCARIYFDFLDEGTSKILIGHVGRHLSTASGF